MSNESSSSRRAKADAARAAANSAGKRRERTMRIVGAIVVIVVVLGIVGIAVVAKNSSGSGGSSSGWGSVTADPAAATPKGVYGKDAALAYGIPVNAVNAKVPNLTIWEDLQCPACDALEKANGSGIQQLAAQGKVNLTYRPTTFLDQNLKNDASLRATAAWGCAIDQGKTIEFHNQVYANPPASEGAGFTDATLLKFAQDSGITGSNLDTFTKCFNAKTYGSWALNSYGKFIDANIPGTPYVSLNGTEINAAVAADPAKLAAAVAAATKQ